MPAFWMVLLLDLTFSFTREGGWLVLSSTGGTSKLCVLASIETKGRGELDGVIIVILR
jgi:hypothetical protein